MSGENPTPEKSGFGTSVRLALIALVFVLFAMISAGQPDLAWPLLAGFALTVFVLWNSWRDHEDEGGTPLVASLGKKGLSESVQSFAEAMQYPIFVINDRANVEFANTKSQTVFGNIGKGDRIFIRFRTPDLKRAIESAMARKKFTRIEYNEPVPDDRWFSVEISPIPLKSNKDRNGQQLFVLGFHELTETKRTDQMRSDFIANASHELRTPLASLLGYLETLKGPAKNDAKARSRFIDTMLNQAERMSRLVNDLLSLSKIEMKSHLRPSDATDLTEVVESVANSLEPLSKQMGVAIEVEADQKFVINGDRDELIQVFENLIENGCKYGQEGKRVVVKLEPDDLDAPKSVRASVRDFGPGIAIEHQHRITERFYRVDVERSREKQGTGLGLAIVKHILQRHGTRLSISSKLGEGVEFSVQFHLSDSVENS